MTTIKLVIEYKFVNAAIIDTEHQPTVIIIACQIVFETGSTANLQTEVAGFYVKKDTGESPGEGSKPDSQDGEVESEPADVTKQLSNVVIDDDEEQEPPTDAVTR